MFRLVVVAAVFAPSAVAVTFDSPGAAPRPIRETVVAVAKPTTVLSMRVSRITYSGLACGFTFHGARPPGPVTIEMTGAMKSGRFASGLVNAAWTAASSEQTDAGSSDDKKAKWLFVAAANTNRNGPGWVISLTGISTDKSVRPTEATCTLKSATAFTKANGPVSYWAGFATR